MLKTYLKEIREKAFKAKDKPAILGPDIDLEPYMRTIEETPIGDLEKLPDEIKENILYSGITPQKMIERVPTFKLTIVWFMRNYKKYIKENLK